ncbi:MAG TPA: L-threonylcarbamoyladenylate synthase [Vicinamibacteria bacterium]
MAQVLTVDADHPAEDVIARATAVLRERALLIYPTDTLYALGGLALAADVARKVREAKVREGSKPLPVVASGAEQARSLCASWPEAAARLAARFWPGPLSLVLPARAKVPRGVTAGTGTVAVRVPARELARRLCADGPLIATSANRAGEAAPRECGEAVAAVGASAALALDGGPARLASSTLVDLTGDRPRLLRAGPVEWKEVLATLASSS